MTTLGRLRIRGTVRKDGALVEGAYLTLNQSGGNAEEFIAERRTGPDGVYEFHTSPGDWVVVCRASGIDAVRHEITAGDGDLEADFDL